MGDNEIMTEDVRTDGEQEGVHAEDSPKYFTLEPNNEGLALYKCLECLQTSPLGTINITHLAYCITWLRMRLEAVLKVHPKLKFQMSKMLPAPVGAYPVWRGWLCSPFIFMETDPRTNRDLPRMTDARMPIQMTKAELYGPGHDEIFMHRRTDATHRILDLVEKGEVPVIRDGRFDGVIKVERWGTLEDHQDLVPIIQTPDQTTKPRLIG